MNHCLVSKKWVLSCCGSPDWLECQCCGTVLDHDKNVNTSNCSIRFYIYWTVLAMKNLLRYCCMVAKVLLRSFLFVQSSSTWDESDRLASRAHADTIHAHDCDGIFLATLQVWDITLSDSVVAGCLVPLAAFRLYQVPSGTKCTVPGDGSNVGCTV